MLPAVVVLNIVVTALAIACAGAAADSPGAGVAIVLVVVGFVASVFGSSPHGFGSRLVGVLVGAVLPVAAGVGAVIAGRAAAAEASALWVATSCISFACGSVGAVLGTAARYILRARRSSSRGGAITTRALLAVGASAVMVATLPAVTDRYLERRLVGRISQCEEMTPFAGRSPRAFQRVLAAGCTVRQSGTSVAGQESGPLNIAVYGNASKTVGSDVESTVAYYFKLLGAPAVDEVAVISVNIPGPIRGLAGPGYVLIDSGELSSPVECASFRSSGGLRGRCGRWVVAHEVAHQWFRWTAFDRGTVANAALVEGPADYLAYRWWRDTIGGADAATLAEELFGERIAMARLFAETHAPVVTPDGMTDGEERALVYGRASAAWLAVERAVGADRTAEALRTVFAVGRRTPHFNEVLSAVQEQDPEAAEVLRTWWTTTPFALRDSEWMPQPELGA